MGTLSDLDIIIKNINDSSKALKDILQSSTTADENLNNPPPLNISEIIAELELLETTNNVDGILQAGNRAHELLISAASEMKKIKPKSSLEIHIEFYILDLIASTNSLKRLTESSNNESISDQTIKAIARKKSQINIETSLISERTRLLPKGELRIQMETLVTHIGETISKNGNPTVHQLESIFGKLSHSEYKLITSRINGEIEESTIISDLMRQLVSLKTLFFDINFMLDQELRERMKLSVIKSINSLNDQVHSAYVCFKSLNNELPKLENIVTTTTSKAEQELSTFIQFINENSDAVKNLVSIFSAEKIGKNYKDRSTKENNAADFFRTSSIAIMILVLFIDISYCALAIFKPMEIINKLGINVDFSTPTTSTIIAISFLMYIPALFLSKESNRHRQIQNHNLQLSNDIDAVLTFISSLPETEQLKLKSVLALVLIQGRNQNEKQDEGSTLLSQELIKQVIGAINPNKTDSGKH